MWKQPTLLVSFRSRPWSRDQRNLGQLQKIRSKNFVAETKRSIAPASFVPSSQLYRKIQSNLDWTSKGYRATRKIISSFLWPLKRNSTLLDQCHQYFHYLTNNNSKRRKKNGETKQTTTNSYSLSQSFHSEWIKCKCRPRWRLTVNSLSLRL